MIRLKIVVTALFKDFVCLKIERYKYYLNDCLAQEVVRLSGQFLSQFWFQVVVFIPYPDLDAIRWVVALTVSMQLF